MHCYSKLIQLLAKKLYVKKNFHIIVAANIELIHKFLYRILVLLQMTLNILYKIFIHVGVKLYRQVKS